jgi:hypothetical protein
VGINALQKKRQFTPRALVYVRQKIELIPIYIDTRDEECLCDQNAGAARQQ